MSDWRPLSARMNPDSATAYEALHEGVPDWLMQSLLDWIPEQLPQPTHPKLHDSLRMVERLLRRSFEWESGDDLQPLRSFYTQIRQDDEFLLDVLDLLLSCPFEVRSYPANVDTLDDALSQGGSAWKVAKRDGQYRLERRLPVEFQQLADSVLQDATNASTYMRLAWQAAYGRSPQPGTAFENAIKAMEAALKPIVIPNDSLATLGKILPAMRKTPHKWQLRLAADSTDDETMQSIITYINSVWKAHLRHGTDQLNAKLEHSLPEARDAVAVAVHILYLVTSSALARRQSESASGG